MVKNFGYVPLDNFDHATREAQQGFAHIFQDTDFLQGGEPYYGHVLELLGPLNEKKIIDLGFGRGFFLREAQKTGAVLHGVDFTPEALPIAQNVVPKAKLVTADMHALPHKKETFDVVVCLGVIEHLVDPAKGVQEAVRILKKNSLAVFTIPNLESMRVGLSKQLVKYHAAKILHTLGLRKKEAVHIRQPIDRFYSPREAKLLLEKNGLKVTYAESVYSKRHTFSILRKYPEGQIPRQSLAHYNANFTLFLCTKKSE